MRYKYHKKCCPNCGSRWYGTIHDDISQLKYECRDCIYHFNEPVPE